MIGNDAFCPKSGATLSDDQHYDQQGRGKRAVEATENAEELGVVGELTAGATRSSPTALLTYFQRCHQRYHEAEDEDLYSKASLALRRLKRAASGDQEKDVHVWHALAYRLDACGYDVDWMHSHAEIRCPHCHGQLRFRDLGDDVAARCATNCTDRRADHLTTIRETVASLYEAAFPDADEPTHNQLLQF